MHGAFVEAYSTVFHILLYVGSEFRRPWWNIDVRKENNQFGQLKQKKLIKDILLTEQANETNINRTENDIKMQLN